MKGMSTPAGPERAGLDWAAFVPSEVPDPAPESTSAAQGRNSDDLRFELATDRWRSYEASARIRAEAGDLSGLPTAAEYATWSDERLAALDADPEDLDDDRWDDEGTDSLDVHPVHLAVDEVERAQRRMREAEAERVLAALGAWRVATASVAGSSSKRDDRVYFDSIVLDLANTLQVSERTATSMIHVATALEVRTPRCWRLFVLGDVPWRVM